MENLTYSELCEKMHSLKEIALNPEPFKIGRGSSVYFNLWPGPVCGRVLFVKEAIGFSSRKALIVVAETWHVSWGFKKDAPDYIALTRDKLFPSLNSATRAYRYSRIMSGHGTSDALQEFINDYPELFN